MTKSLSVQGRDPSKHLQAPTWKIEKTKQRFLRVKHTRIKNLSCVCFAQKLEWWGAREDRLLPKHRMQWKLTALPALVVIITVARTVWFAF